MLRLETIAERSARPPASGYYETSPATDARGATAGRLDRAHAEDLAWRRARSRPVQVRLEYAFGAQSAGQWVAFAGFWVLALGAWAIALLCCLISLCGFELELLLARVFLSPLLFPGIGLVLTVLLGLCLASVGGCHRRQLLRWARKHSIEVEDPGGPTLPAAPGR